MRRAWRGVVATAAAAVVAGAALVVWQPTLQAARDASDLEPGLVEVAEGARGAVSLGNGVYAQLGTGGLVVSRRSRVVFRGVDRGSPVTAGIGRLRWRSTPVLQADEQVTRSLGNVLVTNRRLEANAVTYTGRISDGDPAGRGSLPVTITVTRRTQDSRVVLDADVPGADVVAWHAYRRPGYTYRGLGGQAAGSPVQTGRFPLVTRRPAPATGLLADVQAGADGAAAVVPAPVGFYMASDSTGIGIDSSAYAVVDLRHQGRVDTSVWEPQAQLRVYDGTPLQVLAEHASDLPPVTAPPAWSSSGALVGVRGSTDVVRRSVQRLLDAGAAVAAVVVPGGGATARDPGWGALARRLRERDVRVMTSVSPALALRPRADGPADEAALLATARRHGWLVRTRAGVATVPVDDADRGTVPGALLDLTDADAAQWYTGVLARRMRAEQLAGWVVDGGDELPMDALPAEGDTGATEHAMWPTRWAKLVQAACRQAGVTDCLLLQATADESTGAATGVLSVTGPDPAHAFAAVQNAGVSGLPFVHAPVAEAGTDDAVARATQLAAYSTLLRTDAALAPTRWSAARVATFVTASRVFAATASYRRSVLADAVQSGEPVVRPVTVDEPELTQGSTHAEVFFGDSLLVAPVLRPGAGHVSVGLPPGTWVDLFTGARHTVDGPPDPEPGVQPTAAPARAVQVPVPGTRPVVLVRARDPDGRRVRSALAAAGLLG